MRLSWFNVTVSGPAAVLEVTRNRHHAMRRRDCHGGFRWPSHSKLIVHKSACGSQLATTRICSDVLWSPRVIGDTELMEGRGEVVVLKDGIRTWVQLGIPAIPQGAKTGDDAVDFHTAISES
jgi:hypothetical protein